MHILAGLTPLFALVASGSAVTALPAASVFGTWSNPSGTLAVRTAACGAGLCGSIVWANAKALDDARKAGVTRLIGTELLQNYRPAGPGVWKGRVYVPDMGHSFSSRIVQDRPNQLTISGCLIGGFLCRSQQWRRIG